MRIKRKNIDQAVGIIFFSLLLGACTIPPSQRPRKERKTVPQSFSDSRDSTNSAYVKWKDFFLDSNLRALIDTALLNNQELNIVLNEINIAKNEVKARKGEYLPFMNLQGAAGVEKTPLYTRNGAVDEHTDIKPGKKIPDPLSDFIIAANFTWQVDIWKKLRNAKKSAMLRYLSTIQGKNFMVTHLIAEIAMSYYELMALDNQLEILKQNIEIQKNALAIVRLEKQSARVTELAVRRFEAEVLKNRSRQFFIAQQIVEMENKINFLVGRFPKPIIRNSKAFTSLVPNEIFVGLPSQLLQNRTDIQQAELNLEASKIDVKVAKANFYPQLNISSALGLEAFNASYLITKPESMLFNLAGSLTAPLINRNAIKAIYYTANSKQLQAVYAYERTILTAYVEVANQLSNIHNLKSSYDLRFQQVEALTESINISIRLFKSARADYMEVLLTQRDALESKFELIETKKQQMRTVVNIYQALGGGWN